MAHIIPGPFQTLIYFTVNTLKFKLKGFDAIGLANSGDTDQTGPLGIITICPYLSVPN